MTPDTRVHTYPAPSEIPHSPHYRVIVHGSPIFLHVAKVLHGETATFGGFDFSGVVEVMVRSTRPIQSLEVKPHAAGIVPTVEGREIRFTLDRPQNLTFEINGYDHALHLFANPLEIDPPHEGDPGVIHFGPGVHEVTTIDLGNNSTLHIAGGAVLKCVLAPDETPTMEKNWKGNKLYRNFIHAEGARNVTIRGRGLIDMSGLPWHARNAIVLKDVEGARVEGITILDMPHWGIVSHRSRDLLIENIKQICHRENSDGIDLCNSRNVTVRDSFLRNNDDEICIKTTAPVPAPESEDILVERCVIWNERARGLGITNETRRDIRNVTFRDCDIIRDFSDQPEWQCTALAILVSDSGTMSNIRFENIRVEHSKQTLIYCWIGKDIWGNDQKRGRIDRVEFKNITYSGTGSPDIRLEGHGPENQIENVTFTNLRIGREVITHQENANVILNPCVSGLHFLKEESPSFHARDKPGKRDGEQAADGNFDRACDRDIGRAGGFKE